jgi:TRAP-type C4-dicarboxylate transport system permease small subunit
MKQGAKGPFSLAADAIDNLNENVGFLCGLSVLAASLIITFGVVVRYLGVSTPWQIELATYLLILAVFVGAAYTQKHGGHIAIDLVTIYMPPKPREIIVIIGSVLGLMVATVVAALSWPIWWEAIEFNQHSETLWGPHLAFPYLLIPLGMTLLSLQYIVHIVRNVREFRLKYSGNKPGGETPSSATTQGEVTA